MLLRAAAAVLLGGAGSVGGNSVVPGGEGESRMLAMRDGVRLYTSILGADAQQPQSVLLVRSPYGGEAPAVPGFVTVVQHQRGTKNSEGRFRLFRHAYNDTMDTLEWLAEQTWSNGDVYTEGSSGLGIPQYASVARPGVEQWVKAQRVGIAGANGRSMTYPGGALSKALMEDWMNEHIRDGDKVVQELLDMEYPGEYWKPLSMPDQLDHVTFPAIHRGGWYDCFSHGQLHGFDAYQQRGGVGGKGQSYLIMDPCGHCSSPCGSGRFGEDNPMDTVAPLQELLTYKLFNVNPDAALPAGLQHLNLFIMGPDASRQPEGPGNYYTSLPDWPTPQWNTWYLQADGTLGAAVPGTGSGATNYTYDPSDPAPTLGGNNLSIECGPVDQTSKEGRDDVLTFTSGTLTEHVAVVGSIRANLFVSSSAVDTDFVVTVNDGTPWGESTIVNDGVVRMKWRHLLDPGHDPSVHSEPRMMTPGDVYQVEVEVWPTAYVFAAGHEIRVTVASANYPRFDANTNTGMDLRNTTVQPVVAENTLWHSAQYPSSVRLPAVSLDQLPEYPPPATSQPTIASTPIVSAASHVVVTSVAALCCLWL